MFWCVFIVPVAWDAVARPKCHWENEVLIHWNCVFFPINVETKPSKMHVVCKHLTMFLDLNY